ncbi:hypothetical protein EOD42_02935 [Rhodovarius crocodyli]|uniref:Uncharacterized protein n=1 Tax=Rhodovarius crocodyli TaxID=1979269 RepID=A0A437MN46_9PROT|nr:hypothetical protein [Rhodovarius crocodyli]RVT99078.1 hypothetical protein EOD42_02935 [Rhodovarius crocodyli]
MEITAIAWKFARPITDWVVGIATIGRIRRRMMEMESASTHPLRCTACHNNLKVTRIEDIDGFSGGLWGERLTLTCETPGCAFTERTRNIPFPNARHVP